MCCSSVPGQRFRQVVDELCEHRVELHHILEGAVVLVASRWKHAIDSIEIARDVGRGNRAFDDQDPVTIERLALFRGEPIGCDPVNDVCRDVDHHISFAVCAAAP